MPMGMYIPSISQLYGADSMGVYLYISAWGLVARFWQMGKFEDLKMWSERQGASRFLVHLNVHDLNKKQSEQEP